LMPDKTLIVNSSTHGFMKTQLAGISNPERNYLMSSIRLAKDMLTVFLEKDNQLEKEKDKQAVNLFNKHYKGFKVADQSKLDKIVKAREESLKELDEKKEE